MLYRHFIHSHKKESMAEIYSYVDGMPSTSIYPALPVRSPPNPNIVASKLTQDYANLTSNLGQMDFCNLFKNEHI